MFGLIYAESVISGTVSNQEFRISFEKIFLGGGACPQTPNQKIFLCICCVYVILIQHLVNLTNTRTYILASRGVETTFDVVRL